MKRIESIDVARGFNIILMIIFNYSVTLAYFGVLPTTSNYLYWFVFPRLIAGAFIFLSGMAAFASYSSNSVSFSERYFTRGLRLTVFALLITAFTYVFVPERAILFGILHFFALTSFIVPFFIKYERLNMALGLLLIISGAYISQLESPDPSLLWLGLPPAGMSTFDYFPLLPWLGVLLLGVYPGKFLLNTASSIHFGSRAAGLAGLLGASGKHSLLIYLIHQPVLVLVLLAAGYRFG
ncbi:MAG TPA: DUF1624 domain-containing protein [Candidatus Methanoperedenaceae archaeon]|nr:DUF1624 domain-containing protein [Candidatus Methanoperedenaceae archaeon]